MEDKAPGVLRQSGARGESRGLRRAGVGETKDLRGQRALEEVGLPYRVHALDQVAGDLQSEAYSKISPFHQVPVIDDEGFVLSESGAIVLFP